MRWIVPHVGIMLGCIAVLVSAHPSGKTPDGAAAMLLPKKEPSVALLSSIAGKKEKKPLNLSSKEEQDIAELSSSSESMSGPMPTSVFGLLRSDPDAAGKKAFRKSKSSKELTAFDPSKVTLRRTTDSGRVLPSKSKSLHESGQRAERTATDETPALLSLSRTQSRDGVRNRRTTFSGTSSRQASQNPSAAPPAVASNNEPAPISLWASLKSKISPRCTSPESSPRRDDPWVLPATRTYTAQDFPPPDTGGILDADGVAKWVPSRLMVLGDFHGDWANAMTALAMVGAINADSEGDLQRPNGNDPSWVAGKDVLVITGDVIDRGPESVALLEFLFRLRAQARGAGGDVVLLIGNHEMETMGGLNTMHMYVSFADLLAQTTPEELSQFELPSIPAKKWTAASLEKVTNDWFVLQKFKKSPTDFSIQGQPRRAFSVEEYNDLRLKDDIAAFSPSRDAQLKLKHVLRARRLAKFRPDDPTLGRFVHALPMVAQIGSNVFVHGGIVEKFAQMGVAGINRKRFQTWLEREARGGGTAPNDPLDVFSGDRPEEDGPLWTRSLTDPKEVAEGRACQRVARAIEALNAELGKSSLKSSPPRAAGSLVMIKRQIVGHTVMHSQKPTKICPEDILYGVDTGNSAWIGEMHPEESHRGPESPGRAVGGLEIIGDDIFALYYQGGKVQREHLNAM